MALYFIIEPTINFGSDKRKLITSIYNHLGPITNLAKATHRNVSSVHRDILELENVGIVKSHDQPNPLGHDRPKLVKLTALSGKLEAFIC